MQVRIDHIHLRSRDAIAAAKFYVDVLGAREVKRIGDPVSRVVLDLAGLALFIEHQPDLPTGGKPPHLGLEHIGLTVHSLDDAIAELARHGVPLVSGPTQLNPDLRVAFFDGPDNARFELLQRR